MGKIEDRIEEIQGKIVLLSPLDRRELLTYTQFRLGDRGKMCDGCEACLEPLRKKLDGVFGEYCLARLVFMNNNPELFALLKTGQ